MDTGGYSIGGFEIWRLWVPPETELLYVLIRKIYRFFFQNHAA